MFCVQDNPAVVVAFSSRLRNCFFFKASWPVLGSTQPPVQWTIRILPLAVKGLGRHIGHRHPAELYLHSPLCLHGVQRGTTFFYFTFISFSSTLFPFFIPLSYPYSLSSFSRCSSIATLSFSSLFPLPRLFYSVPPVPTLFLTLPLPPPTSCFPSYRHNIHTLVPTHCSLSSGGSRIS